MHAAVGYLEESGQIVIGGRHLQQRQGQAHLALAFHFAAYAVRYFRVLQRVEV